MKPSSIIVTNQRNFTRFLVVLSAALTGTAYSFHHRPPPSDYPTPTGTTTICFQTKTKSGEPEPDGFTVRTWNPLRLAVLRLGLTEPMGTSPLNYGRYDGWFTCAYCGKALFSSRAKYDSGSGWPSFWRSVEDGAIAYERDYGRMECRCARCNSHLGHVFLDGPRPETVDPTDLLTSPASDPRGSRDARLPRFCINGAALMYDKRNEENDTTAGAGD